MSESTTRTGLRGRSFWVLIVTQFLGAFNDNAWKQVVMLVAISGLVAAEGGSLYLSAATSSFAVAYIVFSSAAGYLADRFSKRTVCIWAKVAEIAVMGLACLALVLYVQTGDRVTPILVLLLMAVQSTFFSPAKYGILPEILDDEELSQGNGIINMTTYLAIIFGTVVGGWLMGLFPGKLLPNIGIVLIAISVLGTATSLLIGRVPPSGSTKRFRVNFLADSLAGLRRVRRDRPLFLAMLANMYIWVFGAVLLQNFAPYAQELMGLTPELLIAKAAPLAEKLSAADLERIGAQSKTLIGLLLGVLSTGIAAGSLLAGKLSGRKVEFGLVPFGAIGITICSMLFAVCYRSLWFTGANLVALGFFVGFFVVPLNAYIQQKSPADKKGETIAVLNFVTFSGIIAAASGVLILSQGLKLNPADIFVVFGVLTIGVTWYICSVLPDFLIRFCAWLATHTVYRFRVIGARQVPSSGPALIVCNHVSLVDAALIQASLQRPVRFVMYRQYYEHPLLHWAAKRLRCIPIAPEDGPKALVAAFHEARAALVEDGALVCIFAEGSVTRTGNLLGFRSGFERIVKGTDVPVIPANLDRVWGSVFSFERGRVFWKWPRSLPYPVTVSYGAPMPSASTAHAVRTRVAELGAEAFEYRKGAQVLLHHAFIRAAKRMWFRPCLSDSSGRRLSYGSLLVAGVLLGRRIRRLAAGDEHVGLLLPPSVGGSVANIAALFAGKVPVNLNYTAPADAVRAAMDACGIRKVLTSRRFVEKARIDPMLEMVMLEDVLADVKTREKLLTAAAALLLPAWVLRRLYSRRGLRADDPVTVIFSSGSTGVPKGVVLSHKNVASNIVGFCQVLAFDQDDCICGVLPFFHSFGFTTTLWAPILRYFRAVYHPNPLDGKTIGRLIREHRATHLISTPTFLMAYTRQCRPEDLRTLNMVVTGAEKLKPRIADAFEAKFGIRPLEGYGCTELSPVVAANIPNVPVGADDVQIGSKEGTIGQPIPNVAAKVVDPEAGQELPAGEDGLLLIKGPNVMLGYLNEPEKTAEVIRDGWYRTGDIAHIDEDGFITITDRLSRFSKIGGEMVPHMAVEDAIHRVLGVGGTERMCAVTSVPDERKGERLAVLHTALPVSVDELIAKLREETELPNLWIPRKNLFHQVKEIPVLGSGKIALSRIKRMAAEALETDRGPGEKGGQ